MEYFEPHHTIRHSKLNRYITRTVLFVVYIWNKYILRKKVIPVYSCISMSWGRLEQGNWGDDLVFHFLSKISRDYLLPSYYECYPFGGTTNFRTEEDEYTTIGSLIQWLRKSNVIVWGTGIIDGSLPVSKKLDIRAVRGPLTRKVLMDSGFECPSVYGDPALLLPLYYQPKLNKKKYKLGIVLHNTDYYRSEVERLKKDPNVLVIRLFDYGKWTNVIDQICDCECVVSSSLHGLIVAEAYKVPNAWVEITEPLTGKMSARFKFYDFFHSVGKYEEQPITVSDQTNVDDLISITKSRYNEGHIDLVALLKACPFELNIQIYK